MSDRKCGLLLQLEEDNHNLRLKLDTAERERDRAMKDMRSAAEQNGECFAKLREERAKVAALEAVAKVWEDGGHGLIGHYARGDHQYSGIHVACWLRDFVAALQPAAPPTVRKGCCEICGLGPAPEQGGVTVYRQNETGVAGIWRCREHNQQPRDPEVDDIVDLLDPPIDAHDCTEPDRDGPTYPREGDFADPIPDPVREAVAERTRQCACKLCGYCRTGYEIYNLDQPEPWHLINGEMVTCKAGELRRSYPECFQMGAKEDEMHPFSYYEDREEFFERVKEDEKG